MNTPSLAEQVSFHELQASRWDRSKFEKIVSSLTSVHIDTHPVSSRRGMRGVRNVQKDAIRNLIEGYQGAVLQLTTREGRKVNIRTPDLDPEIDDAELMEHPFFNKLAYAKAVTLLGDIDASRAEIAAIEKTQDISRAIGFTSLIVAPTNKPIPFMVAETMDGDYSGRLQEGVARINDSRFYTSTSLHTIVEGRTEPIQGPFSPNVIARFAISGADELRPNI